MELDDLISQLDSFEPEFVSELEKNTSDIEKLEKSVSNFRNELDDIDERFDNLTKLQKEDYIFIVFCAALLVRLSNPIQKDGASIIYEFRKRPFTHEVAYFDTKEDAELAVKNQTKEAYLKIAIILFLLYPNFMS